MLLAALIGLLVFEVLAVVDAMGLADCRSNVAEDRVCLGMNNEWEWTVAHDLILGVSRKALVDLNAREAELSVNMTAAVLVIILMTNRWKWRWKEGLNRA